MVLVQLSIAKGVVLISVCNEHSAAIYGLGVGGEAGHNV